MNSGWHMDANTRRGRIVVAAVRLWNSRQPRTYPREQEFVVDLLTARKYWAQSRDGTSTIVHAGHVCLPVHQRSAHHRARPTNAPMVVLRLRQLSRFVQT